MNILLAIDNLGRGGRERRMVELIKGLLKSGSYTISLVVFSNRIEYEEVFDLDIQVFKLPRKPKKDPRVFFRFFNICKQVKPQLIHSWGDMATLYVVPSSFMLGIRLINGSVVNAPADTGWSDPEFFRKKLALPFSSRIIGNSQAGLKAFQIPHEKAVCIHNGFDFKRASQLKDPALVKEEFSITTPKVIGMMGAFEDRKDYRTYFEAARKVLDAGYDVTFLAIGDGKNRTEVEASIEPQYKDNIIFTGLQKEVESIIQIMDIGVLSTNADLHGEGISNAILEYMALGKPVIATNGGGTPEIVQENETGYLVPNKTPKIMAMRMIHLLENPSVATKMGISSRERIKKHFNLEDMTAHYQEVYENELSPVPDLTDISMFST